MCVPESPLHIEGTSCPPGWPQHGEITFQDYRMKYRDNTPIILNGINLTIHGHEVVGIVGRTGSGESMPWASPVLNSALWVLGCVYSVTPQLFIGPSVGARHW